MEVEIEVLRREREILLHRIGELEQLEDRSPARQAPGPAKEGGMIHSVNIKTNNTSAIDGSGSQGSPVKDLVRRASRSQSDLTLGAEGVEVNKHHQRFKAASQDHLGGPGRQGGKLGSGVSVVNLSSPNRSSSPYTAVGEGGSALSRSRTNSFGAPHFPRPGSGSKGGLLPGRMAGRKSSTSSALHRLHEESSGGVGGPHQPKGLKSRSVEHLPAGGAIGSGAAGLGLGLKAANSEMTLIQKVGPPSSKSRLKGTHSELNVSR